MQIHNIEIRYVLLITKFINLSYRSKQTLLTSLLVYTENSTVIENMLYHYSITSELRGIYSAQTIPFKIYSVAD